jgi:hypothetical protein
MEVYDEYQLGEWDDIQNFDGNSCSTITNVVNFVEYNIWYEITHIDVQKQLFLLSFDKKQRNLIKHACIPKGPASTTI